MSGFLTVPVTSRAQVPLVNAGDGRTLISNGDLNNTIYLSSDYGAQPGQANTTPLAPGGFLSVDGENDVYGVCLTGQSANAYVIPGGLSFFQLVEILAKIIQISGSAGNGLYVYNGAPALGDLVESIRPNTAPTNDPDGNLTFGGLTFYNPGPTNFSAASFNFAAVGNYANGSGLFINISPKRLTPTDPFGATSAVFGFTWDGTNAQFIVAGPFFTGRDTTALEEVQGNLALALQAAGNALEILVHGDTNNRLQIDNNGKHEWGPGNAAVDTNLYRSAANILKTDDEFNANLLNVPANAGSHFGVDATGRIYLISAAPGGTIRALTQITGDTNNRWQMDDSGIMQWGSGSSGVDTSLKRSGTNTLETAGAILYNLAVAGQAIKTKLTTDTIVRFEVDEGGKIQWGAGGANALDTDLYRKGAGQLGTDGQMFAQGLFLTFAGFLALVAPGTTLCFYVQAVGQNFPSFQIDANGTMTWGTGTVAGDATLSRSSAGVLASSKLIVNSGKTGNAFSVGTGPSDFAGTVYLEDTSAPGTPGTASGLYSNAGKLHYVSEDSNDYTTGESPSWNTVTQTINSASFVNVTGLSAHVGIGSYAIDINLVYTEQATAGVPSFQLTGPAASLVLTSLTVQQTGTPPSNSGGRTSSGFGSSMGLPTMGSVGRNQIVRIHCRFTTTAAGTVQLQALTSIAADTYDIQAGSDMILTPA